MGVTVSGTKRGTESRFTGGRGKRGSSIQRSRQTPPKKEARNHRKLYLDEKGTLRRRERRGKGLALKEKKSS